MKNYDQLIDSALAELESCESLDLLESIRIKYFGKNGEVTSILKNISNLSETDKKDMGKKVNLLKQNFFHNLEKKKNLIEQTQIKEKLKKEQIDISLPTREVENFDSKLHPITHTVNEIVSILGNMGLNYEEGPDIENDFYNFTALNIPENHPAREMHDTFYIKNNQEKLVLRTHTSPVQVRNLKKKKFPLRIFAPGRTYRCDSDITHTPMFHQVEGLVVDHLVTFANLKWFLEKFCKTFFDNEKLKLRFRPSYFPFTEPSAEVDINCSITSGKITLGEGDKWMEILGCGMVHPNVLKMSGVDDDKLRGFAFGMGIERLSMLKYGMPDLRDFYDSNINWLSHYGFSFLETTDLSWR
ncbi:MAG: phenylalanine--tRNA ligase subunit alpha [Pelagibacteraceae bacterium TMED124]|nr:phenylalanine--tRNA ligase subunit alpha [Rickettsiales bacterium]RPG16507.1 MAG: phenylalanine--tRNA ligase subunit alpha [Pelagibacteraceae bacterium TMED124]|tara:strand:+ start:236 stop:1303 length:1068 start_codon:yes stop_codon:yes gene_type:complete